MNPVGFAWDIGQYKNPNIIVPAVGPAPQPVILPCPGSTVIYAADAGRVANCAAFAGFGGGNPWTNPFVINALVRATGHLKKVTCGNPCDRVASLIWIGWDCGANPLTGSAAVEIQVDCVLANVEAINAFKEACRGLDELPAPIFLGHGWSPARKRSSSKMRQEPSKKKKKK
jgi:hypothetical protein